MEKRRSDHAIAFMQRYEQLRKDNFTALIRGNKLKEFEQEVEETGAAVLRIFDAGKVIRMLGILAGGLTGLGVLFLVSGLGLRAGFFWARPLAFWSTAVFGAGYIGYAVYSVCDRYRAVREALKQHYSVMAIADPGSPPGNPGAEALWSVILNLFSSPSIILHLFAAGVIVWLLSRLR